ncbi:MAG: ATP-binding protein [Clostridia bacterium]|nr:ATP-binding protein [Clostridia bacterium]
MKIPRRCSTVILSSLSAGVVPPIGLEYIAVGRKREVEAILRDLENIENGGGAFRFVVGQYGSGKSFLLQLARNNALERNFIVADADLSPERRLTGTKGQGLNTYRELISHLSTKNRPEGNALELLLQKWIMDLKREVEKEGIAESVPEFLNALERRIKDTAFEMQTYLYGHDLAKVLLKYWQGYRDGNDELQQSALKWIRGEYEKKAEARGLGVSQIISDETWYEFIKLIARLSVKLGYKGMLVLIDEEVNLYKITNSVSRNNNYEKILSMFNDIMQGKAAYLGMLVGGTPQAVEDERRGLFSYEALKTRLQKSKMLREGLVDYTAPIIHLNTLTHEEIFVLLERIRDVFCAHNKIPECLTEDQLLTFMEMCVNRIGADKLLTPREVTRGYLALLNVLYQNPDETFESLLQAGKVQVQAEKNNPDELDDGKYAAFDDL